MPRRPATAALLLLAVTSAACGSGPTTARPAAAVGDGPTARVEPLQVAAAFYPAEFLARAVGRDAVQVEGLTTAGAEPHDLELTPRQVARLGEVDLVVHLGGFQPAVDEAVAQQAADRALDLAGVQPLEQGYVPLEEGELHGDEEGADPHVWLDPSRMQGLADAVAHRLGAARPEQAPRFQAAAAELGVQLRALDREYQDGLRTCERRHVVTAHNAFGYLARAYDLEQVPVAGLVPDAEPTPARVAAVADEARRTGTTTIFFEDTASPATAAVLAREVGARAQVLTPLERAPDEGDYLSAMRANLAALRQALGCT